MSKINIKLRQFPGNVGQDICIEMVEGRHPDKKRSKVYKKIRRMNEKARMKELDRKKILA
jgi:hypothetical protein